MYTQCPICETYFRVTAEDLAHADGQVRCSRCEAVFDARSALRTEFADPELGAPPDAPAAPIEPTIGDLFGTGDPAAGPSMPALDPTGLDAAFGDQTPAGPRFDAATLGPDDLLAPLPDAGRPRARRAPWIAASVLLALTLSAQVVHAFREPLARDPHVGGLLVDAYRRLDVPISEPTDLAKLTVQHADVTSHPLYRDVLFITATVTNEAEFPQPLPLLRVRLDDRWGEPVGVRLFAPAEYLRHAPESSGSAAPGRAYAIALEVVDPGSEAVGYALSPCLPSGGSVICLGDDPGAAR